MAVNPILFGDYRSDERFAAYAETLGEFGWKNRLVGLVSDGFLYVDDRVSRMGHYEFHPKLLPWEGVVGVETASHFSGGGILLGMLCLLFGLGAFYGGWIAQTHVGPGIVTIPLLSGAGGFVLIFGARRNRIRVESVQGKRYRWMSAPLAYARTLPICREVAVRCRRHRVRCASHVEAESAG